MKKFIKKTLAGLIAGVMAVSSMPFAALTVQAADSTEKAYVKEHIADFTGYTGTAKYTYNGTEASSYYSNLLYTDGAFNDNTSQSDSDNMHGKLYINDNVVLMYDGKNDTILPVVERAWTTSKFAAAAIYYSGSLIEDSTTSSSWQLNENWLGGQQTYSEWPTGTNSYPSSNISYGSGLDIRDGSAYIFKNKLYYKGTSSTDSYYEKFNNSIKLKIKAYYYSSKSKDIDVTNSTSNVYVVNYKLIADKIGDMQAAYKAIQTTGEDKYCTDALENFYQAAYKVMTLNPNTYSYDKGVETAVQSVANAIKDVVENYLGTATTEPTKHTYSYAQNNEDTHTVTCSNTKCTYSTTEAHDFNGDTCSKCGYAKKTTYTFVNAEGTTVGTVEATSAAEALQTVPENTETKYEYVDNTNHNKTTYSWPSASEVTGTTITEKSSTVSEEHSYGETPQVCKYCGEYIFDTSSYDSALAEAKEKVTNTDKKYTTGSIEALDTIIAEVEADRKNVKTQAQLDALTTKLAVAIANLAVASNTVTFYTVDANTSEEKQVDSTTLAYGATYTANAGANVKQWVVKTDEKNTYTKLNTFDSSVDVIVTKNVSIYAYLSNEDTSATSSKVTFLGKNNQVVAIKYVKSGETLLTSTVEIPEIPFYSAGTWSEESITGDGNEYTVKASYTYLLGATNCTVNFVEGNDVTWHKDYSYDSYVYLTKADKSKKYALYSDKDCTNLLTYLDGIDFYAPKTSAVYVKEYTEAAQAAVAVTGSFSDKTTSKKYANFNCKFYLPEGATAVEWGLEVQLANGKYAKVKGETKSERNEYTIRLGTSSATSISGRAYLVYSLGGVNHTINSGDFTTVQLN